MNARKGMVNFRLQKEAEESKKDQGMYLDREINDEDIWVVMIGGKKIIGGLTSIGKMKRPIHGKVIQRFIKKNGRVVENYG